VSYDLEFWRGIRACDERLVIDRLVDRLNLTAGASLDDVVRSVADAHRKPISLEPIDDARLTTLTGLWVETAKTSYVFFRASDPLIYRIHSIFHEFGHILLEHEQCDALATVEHSRFDAAGLGGEIRRARELGTLGDVAEYRAELVAVALSNRVLRVDPCPSEAVFG
jgi:hypothetical protein